jgi:hypothetical protein
MSSRRRRKSKPKKSSGKSSLKWFAWSSLVLVVLLIIGVILGYNAVRSYLKSDDFRTMLGAQAGELLEGDADFDPFKWDGWNVSTSRFSFAGEESLKAINAMGIDASVDIGAVWNGVYRIRDIRLREVEVIGDFTKDSLDDGQPSIEIYPLGSEASSEPGFLERFLPDEVEITSIDVAEIYGRAVTDDGIWSWKDTSASVVPGATDGVYDVALQGGEIRTPLSLVDRLSLNRAKGRYSGDHFYLLSSEFEAFESARVNVDGDFGVESGRWQFDGEVRGARIEEIIAEDWKQRLMGPLEVDFKVTGEPEQDAHLRGSLKITNGVLTALPMLDRIAAYANTVRFRRLALSEAQLDFSKRGETIDLRNIRLASEGLIRLEGSMRLAGDVIEHGEFRLGITPGTLAHLPGAETKVFQRGDLGLLWTPLSISGTLNMPQEDLSERLIAAAGERMFELVPETGQWALKYSGEAIGESTRLILENQGVVFGVGQQVIDQAGELLNQGAGDALKTGSDLIEGGVGTLFDIFGRPIPKRD